MLEEELYIKQIMKNAIMHNIRQMMPSIMIQRMKSLRWKNCIQKDVRYVLKTNNYIKYGGEKYGIV